MSKIYRSVAVVFGVWLLVWVRLSWPAVQDDAYIHLRYAVNLLRYHMISYNGVHPDYGTSSLLYVWLLAGLRSFIASPVLPRAVSSVFHVALFGGVALALGRTLRSAPKVAWGFALVLLALLVTPMSVRWLDDGMETSLTLCLVALLAFSVSRLCHSRILHNRSLLWLFVLGFVATLTRVEYLMLFGIVSLLLFVARLSLSGEATTKRNLPSSLRLAARCASPLLGSLLAAALIYCTMHALVPDTAIAKASGDIYWHDTLNSTVEVLVSALSFGGLLFVFWLLTAFGVIAYKRRVTLPILLANSLFPITLALAALRGQAVQGVRYFLWTLLFAILWNILELQWSVAGPRRSIERVLRFATYGVAVVLLVLMPIESKLLYKEFRAREQSLATFRTQHLERLRSLELVAYDIGYIGYFTQSPVCDMAGLVNGRALAGLSFDARTKLCAEKHPQYAFLSFGGLGDLRNNMDLKGWSICSVYNLANLRSPDLHYLVASPAATADVCAAAGSSPRLLEPVLRGSTP